MGSVPDIHIGIEHVTGLSFVLSGKFEIKGTGKRCYGLCSAVIKNGRLEVQSFDTRMEFQNEVTFNPCNIGADYFELPDVRIGIDFHWEKKEVQRFQGSLKLILTGREFAVINIIPAENYLYSVISSEMSANSSLDLLKAHAIVSRSWLMSMMQKMKEAAGSLDRKNDIKNEKSAYIKWYDREDHELFHVCADDHCQRYQGITRMHNSNVITAVNETRGKVIMSEGNLCDARYSKCCGGVSEEYENCWESVSFRYLQSIIDIPGSPKGRGLNLWEEERSNAFIRGNPDAFCNTSDEKILSQVLNDYDLSTKNFYRWKKVYDQDELSEIINKKSGIDFGRIKSIFPVARGFSGRLVKLQLNGTKESLIIGKELVIRRWLSPSHLLSSAIVIETLNIDRHGIPQKFIFHGAGWGHGVGLCQIGAAVMGEKGHSFTEIINHYYKGVEIKRIYS